LSHEQPSNVEVPVGPPAPAPRGGGAPSEFFKTGSLEAHRNRAQSILQHHPEVRQQIGKTPITFWILLGIVLGQVVLAAALASSSWWLILLVAATLGAFANHALWVTIHECTHNLVFKSPAANTVSGIVANLPHILPTSVLFQRYHMRHHAFLGVYELDADLPYRWEARLVGNSAIRKAIWLLIFPIMQSLRPARLKEIKPIDRFVVLNFVAQGLFDVGVWYLLGPKAFLYLLISFFFSVGLHPLGARWIQEHYMLFPGQQTSSYYGPVNRFAMNIGYHNEHHDFPSIPWNHLPDLKRLAPEAYDTLGSHKSWTAVLWRFLFDPEISLFNRQIRQRPGVVRVDDDTQHDVELIESLPQGPADPPTDPVATN
jgi:sphingolipid delta-4 desaturase